MFETDFLLKVLEDNGENYYDEEEDYISDYQGIKGSIRAIKTKIAIALLVKKDPNALLQYIYSKIDSIDFLDASDQVKYSNAQAIREKTLSDHKLFKILLKKVDPELLGKLLYKQNGYFYGKSRAVLFDFIFYNNEFGKKLCKGIMTEYIDEREKDGTIEDYGIIPLLMKMVIEKMDTPIRDYGSLIIWGENGDFYLIYNSLIRDLCVNDEERKEVALRICEQYIEKGSKQFTMLKKKIEKGILKPRDLSKAFTEGMEPDDQAINSFLISNTFALSDIPVEKQKEVNLKEFNKLLKISSIRFPLGLDEKVVLNMMLSLGFKHTQDILEGKYGDLSIDLLIGAFKNINPNDFEMADKQVKHTRCQEAMVRFLFGNGVNDENSNIRRLLRGEVDTNLGVVVRNWRLIYALSSGKVKLSEISGLLDDSVLLLQDYQQPLRSIINEAGPDYLEKILETYDKMLQRSESTIPKVKGQVGDLEYEVLDLDSVEQMSVGYVTKCCFTFEGESSESLKHALTSDSGRILVIRKNGKLVAQSWLWRDGNVLCFDDIETTGLSRKADETYLRVCVAAAGKLLEASAEAEPEKERIEIVTVGISPNAAGIQEHTAEKILTALDSDEVITPQSGLYTDAGVQYVLGKSHTYEHSKRFTPKVRYQDERAIIVICDPQQSSEEEVKIADQTIKKIEAISKSEREIEASDFTFVMYGKDWFIGISPEGSVVEGVFGSDKRQSKEMIEAYKMISEKSKSGELTVFLDDAELSKRMEAKTNGTK